MLSYTCIAEIKEAELTAEGYGRWGNIHNLDVNNSKVYFSIYMKTKDINNKTTYLDSIKLTAFSYFGVNSTVLFILCNILSDIYRVTL